MTAPHNDRCASLLGQGCDCRSPWPDTACPYCGAPLILAPRDPFDFDGIEVEKCSGCRSYTEPTGRLHRDKGDTR